MKGTGVLFLTWWVAAVSVVAATPGDLDKVHRTALMLGTLGQGLTEYIVNYDGVPVDVGLFQLVNGDGRTPALRPYLEEWSRTDAWGADWFYRPDGKGASRVENWAELSKERWVSSHYVVVSGGPDRRVGTADDLLMRDGLVVGLPNGMAWADFAPDEASHETEVRATKLCDTLQILYSQQSGMPEALIEIPDSALPAGYQMDGWGVPWRYSKNDTGFAVTSAGPDRAFGTSDDYQVVWRAPASRR